MSDLSSHEAFLAALRTVDGLTERGKTGGHFYAGSSPVIHFHGTGADRCADLRRTRTSDWERLPAATPEDRAALLGAVRSVVGTP